MKITDETGQINRVLIDGLTKKIDKLETKTDALEETYKYLLKLMRERSYYSYRNKPLKDLIKLIKRENKEIKDLLRTKKPKKS